MPEPDDTRPITCVKCGRWFHSPKWVGLQGPLCAACFDRLQREESVRLHPADTAGRGVKAWIRRLLGR